MNDEDDNVVVPNEGQAMPGEDDSVSKILTRISDALMDLLSTFNDNNKVMETKEFEMSKLTKIDTVNCTCYQR